MLPLRCSASVYLNSGWSSGWIRSVQSFGDSHLLGRDAENLVEARREIDGVVGDIPVVEILVDRFERERVALGVAQLARPAAAWLALGAPGRALGCLPALTAWLRLGLFLGLCGSTSHARNRHPKSPNPP